MMLLRRQLQMREDLLTDYQLKSRMMGDYHVRFCEGLGGKFPRSTRPMAYNTLDAIIETHIINLTIYFNLTYNPIRQYSTI